MKCRLLVSCSFCLFPLLAWADLREGLVSYWPLDSTPDGVITPDVTPHSNHLSLVNMSVANFVAGIRNNAATFDGTSQYLSRTYTAGEDNGLPIYNARRYTISMWVKGTGTNQQTRTVFGEGNTANNNPFIRLTTDTASSGRTNILAAAIQNDNSNQMIGTVPDPGKSTLMVFDGNWHHIAWVDSGGTARLFVDGQLDPHVYKNTRSSEPQGSVTTTTLNDLTLGALQQVAVSGYFNGMIDDVAIWERALSQTEVNSMRTNGIPNPITAAAPLIVANPVGDTNLVVGSFFSLRGLASGSHPRGYQWLKNGAILEDLIETNEFGVVTNTPITGTTNSTLVLTNLQASFSGNYSVIISNNSGSITSAPTTLLVGGPIASPSLTNGQISYWPLDSVQGSTTPDVVRGYDMQLFNLTSNNIVAGKWGNAVKFNTNGMLNRIHSGADALPISQYRNYTVSCWINALMNVGGPRFFSEGASVGNNVPFLSLANCDTTAQGPLSSVRAFLRNNDGNNAAGLGVGVSTIPAFYDPNVSPNGEWHHVVYVQREVGGADPALQAAFYIDGVKDTNVTSFSPRSPLSVDTTVIGGVYRVGVRGNPFTGLIDDVAVWNRVLTDEEILMLSTNVTPAAPQSFPPINISSFKSDFAEVVSGNSVTLRWNVSSYATQIEINQGIGSVFANTVGGIGSVTVPSVNATTTYTLTIRRGSEVVSNQTTVVAVSGVAAGWNILDNFQIYAAGGLSSSPKPWFDLRGGCTIEDAGSGNMVLNVPASGGSEGQVALLPLAGFSVLPGQARTLFARIYVKDDPAAVNMLNLIGLTDKNVREYRDSDDNVGPVAYISDQQTATDLYPGAIGELGVVTPTFLPRPLEYLQVYNLWIDVTNAPFTDTNSGDIFSIYVQRLGETGRTVLFANYNSDRSSQPDFLGPVGPNLDKLIIGNRGTVDGEVYFDDLFISQSGYNATVPTPWTTPVPATPTVPTLTADTSVPGQITFTWDGGALMSAPTVNGPWSVVTNAFGFNLTATIDQSIPQEYFRIQR